MILSLIEMIKNTLFLSIFWPHALFDDKTPYALAYSQGLYGHHSFFLIHKLLVISVIMDIAFLIKLPH